MTGKDGDPILKPEKEMLRFRLINEPRRTTYSIILGVWLIVAAYAVLHDQYIVRITPELFTVHHDPLWNIRNPKLLAAAYAFRASIGPGLILGITCAMFGRNGSATKVSPEFIFRGTFAVVVATELVSVASGLFVFLSKSGLYPPVLYPDSSLPMLVTTTIQISCYLFSAVFSAIFLGLIWRRRITGSGNPQIENAAPVKKDGSSEP